MKKNFVILTTFIAFLTLAFCACIKKNCYDAALYELHKNDICTEDWQNVTGCDGKKYGNECDANRQGIRLR